MGGVGVLRLRSLQSAQAASLRMTNLVGGKKKNKQGQTVGERVYVRGVGIGRENNPTITMRTFVRIVIMGHPGSGAAPEITPPDGWRSPSSRSVVSGRGGFRLRGRRGSAHRDQSSKKAFSSQRNKEERMSARKSNDFGTSRKSPIKHRAKRNDLSTLWTQSFFLVPL